MSTVQYAMEYLLSGSIVVLAILICLCFVRAVKGPRIADRIVAVNMIGTLTIMIICVLAVYLKESYLVDVAIVYAMISFLAVVILCKVYTGVYLERKKKEGDR
ncbi:MAG: monovalent cation/H+ antiporter complex subunit F [bacterium]|nr:monovalent cation/H+ antiporter complex subunit F [bacterium]